MTFQSNSNELPHRQMADIPFFSKSLRLTSDVISLTVQKFDVLQKLHAGWFINRTPGEFTNWGLFIKFKGVLCGNPTERGESLN